MTKTLVLMAYCTCTLGGCAILPVCPQIRGTVVDAVTRAPVASAKVTVEYSTPGCFNSLFNPKRVTKTDSQGRFSFGARDDLFFWTPAPVDYMYGFSVEVKADGYLASDSMEYGLWLGGPDMGETAGRPPGTPKMVYDSEGMVIDPIALARAPAKAPTK